VRVLGWIKPLITSRIGERQALEHAATLLPQMDAEVEALGRSTSARNVALEEDAVVPG
jgi:hypothetical protein